MDFLIFITNWEVQSIGLKVGLLSVRPGQLEGMGLQEPHEIQQGQMQIQYLWNMLTLQHNFLNTVNGF